MRALGKFLVIFLVLAILGRVFLFEIGLSESYDMVPNIIPGDVILISTRSTLSLGDAVVCHDPNNPSRIVISRIVAVPGQRVAMRSSNLILGGETVDHEGNGQRSYLEITRFESALRQLSIRTEHLGGYSYDVGMMARAGNSEMREIEVKDGFFLLGDNRNRAYDSRQFGVVPASSCVGQALLVLWPGATNGDFMRSKRFPSWI